MTEPRIWESTIKPAVIEKLGNGAYYYNYKITEKVVEVEDQETGEKHQETRWDFIQAYIKSQPDYRDAITAILRQYISADEEMALINKYNSFKMGITSNYGASAEYEEYCKLVAEIKAQVKADFKIPEAAVVEDRMPISNKAVYELLKIVIKTTGLSDNEALVCKALYPAWIDCIGGSLKAGDKVTYKEALYKTRQDISVVLENQAPGVETASLYEEINESHAGTIDDPIPYNNNMALTKDLYYTQDGVVYKCTRDTGIAVFNPLKDLVGIYVEEV